MSINGESISALEIAKNIHDGETSSLEVVSKYLQRIYELNDELNAFITICDDDTLSLAESVDKRIKRGDIQSKLAGLPIAIKDNICTKGITTTTASRMLQDYIPPYNATAVQNLIDSGIIPVGKTNLDEFGMGSSNENSFFGPVKNPHDLERSPGGSSGGAVSAVASDMVPLSIGTDAGGSIRQPAAFTGVVGLKPTYGLVSRYGLISFIPSTDQIGPVCKTVGDCAELLTIISGYDERDSNSIECDSVDYIEELHGDISDIRVGVVSEWLSDVDPVIKSAVESAVEVLSREVKSIEEITLPNSRYSVATYRLIADAEASSNMARYDGVNFGYREESYENLLDMYRLSRGNGLGDEVKRRIMIGTFILSHGYQDRYYKKAIDAVSFIKEDFQRAFERVDLLLAPTTPTLPFKLGELIDDPLALYLADIFVTPASLAGVPAMSIPFASGEGSLPVGLQIIGNYLDEARIMRLGKYLEGCNNI